MVSRHLPTGTHRLVADDSRTSRQGGGGVVQGMGAQRDDGSSDLDRVAGQGDARARGRLGRLSEIEGEMHFLLIAFTRQNFVGEISRPL